MPVALRVIDVDIPDALAFHVSLNTYGTPDPERGFHRLAHEHRATLAIVPYSHHGNVEDGYAPAAAAWYERFGPLFDGSAFQGLPRDAAPLDHFYLPLHESWPTRIRKAYAYKGTLDDHWRDAPPIEKAFPESYAREWRETVRAIANRVEERKWRTDFHVYLNNKSMYWKADEDACWWSLDEPMFRDDFLAIAYFARLFREGRKGSKAPLRFRIDLSRPEWRRDQLDGLIDHDVISGVYRDHPRCVFGRGEDVWTYGTTLLSAHEARAWVVRSFLDGCDGVVPWQTVGSAESWSKHEDTAVMLPKDGKAFATLRLKMLRRGELDVELLRLLLAKRKWTREEVRAHVSSFLADPDRAEALRRAVLAAIE